MNKKIFSMICSGFVVFSSFAYFNASALKNDTVASLVSRAKSDIGFRISISDVLPERMFWHGAAFHTIDTYCYVLNCKEEEICDVLGCKNEDLNVVESAYGRVITNKTVIKEFLDLMDTVYFELIK